jgi:hypothetical protein
MAVPSSGTLTMQGIAQERLYGTYGTGTITGPIVTTDLINGGNSGGSGNNYPALNTHSPSGPNTSTPHAINEWYGYNQNYSSLTSFYITNPSPKGGAFSCTYTTNLQRWHNGSGSVPANGSIVYSNSSGTTFGSAGYFGFAPTNSVYSWSKGYISSSGVVSNNYICLQP